MSSPEGQPVNQPEQPADFEKQDADLQWEISQARNFDELYAILKEAQVFESRKKTYTAEEVISCIESIRGEIRKGTPLARLHGSDVEFLNDLGMLYGLRDKLVELFETETSLVSKEEQERLEDDPIALRLLNEKALEHLKVLDPEWIERSYNPAADGENKLNDAAETAFRHLQLIVGDNVEPINRIIEETKAEISKSNKA